MKWKSINLIKKKVKMISRHKGCFSFKEEGA